MIGASPGRSALKFLLDCNPIIYYLNQQLPISSIPMASRAELVGTAFSPSKATTYPDGTVVNTLWGELAYQLGGPHGHALIASSDQQRVAPGAQVLAALFTAHAPCLILVDEWVVYARNLVSNATLPAETFDSQVSFAQALTEAVKQVPNALLLISVPQSVNEIGGSDGEKAVDSLKNVVTRIAYQWRPATPPGPGGHQAGRLCRPPCRTARHQCRAR